MAHSHLLACLRQGLLASGLINILNDSLNSSTADETALRWHEGNERLLVASVAQGLTARAETLPANIYVELVNACNLACPFCATQFENRPRKLLDFADFRKLIGELAALGAYPRLTFAGQGEPFLNKEALAMIAYARSAGFPVWLITNATMLDRERIEALLACGINRVQFSIDSIDPHKYAALRKAKNRRESYFAKAMGNIVQVIRRNYELGSPTFVAISSVQTELNAGDADTFRDFWQSLPVHHVFLAPLATLQSKSPLEEAKERAYRGSMADKPVCILPFIGAKLNSDGTLNICPHDFDGAWPVGNIKQDSFLDMWNGPKAQELRQALLSARVESFAAIGHDCHSCNNPLIGYGAADFCAAMATRIERMRQSFSAPKEIDETRYARLLEVAERFPLQD